ncbi:MAG: resA 1, partial [Planctomycetaceae bacterium]|nr:resA 1 [Planctomycetaceae bacterium]
MTALTDLALLQFVVKLSLWLSGAWVLQVVLSQRNPRWRVGLWRMTTLGVVILSVAWLTSPWYELPWLPRGVELAAGRPASTVAPHNAVSNSAPLALSGVSQQGTQSPDQREGFSSFSARKPEIDAVTINTLAEVSETVTRGTTNQVSRADSPIVPKRTPAIDWPLLLFVSYATVAGWLILKVVLGLALSRRATSLSVPVPEWVQTIAEGLTREHHIPVRRVRMTTRFQSPVLCGVVRPVILVPESMLHGDSAARDVKAALAHEAAHAAGGDLPWDMLIALVSAIFWPNPLLWRVRAAHRAACEQVSDRIAADILGDVAAYQSVLAGLALRVAAAPGEVGLAMARRAEIRTRLESLIRLPRAARLGRRGLAIGLCILGAISLIGFGSLVARPESAVAADQPAVKPTTKTAVQPAPKIEQPTSITGARLRPPSLKFKILRTDNIQPVGDAKISMRMYGKPKNITVDITTNADGEATFEYPGGDQPVNLSAIVQHPGLVKYYVGFGRSLVPAALPTEKTIRMESGKKIGGKVVDADHKPVAGARVSIAIPATDTPAESYYDLLDAKTAEDGTWSLDGAPLNVAGLNLRIEHSRFITKRSAVLDREDGEYQLDAGLTLTGRVVDGQGRPVPKVQVTVGRSRWEGRETSADVKADGSYIVYALEPQSTLVTAEAPGLAPQVQQVAIDQETKPVDFQLLPGQTTRFQVVDMERKPVAGMRIVADTWKGFRSLRWDAVTDAQGAAVWNGAPQEAVTYHMVGIGYAAQRDVVVGPQADPHVITVHKPLKVQGTVLDSQEQKIPEFRVGLGRQFPGRREIRWIDYEGSIGRNGAFEIDYDEFCEAIYLRIEANGFEPWISEAIPFGKSIETLLVHLKAGAGPSGVVLSPDGKPAAGANLVIVTEQEGLEFSGGFKPVGGKQKVVADKLGRFEFLAVTEPALIVAVADSGYAEVATSDFIKTGEIRLQAWAKIEAVVHYKGQALADVNLVVFPENERGKVIQIFSYGITGKTDAAGRVFFNQVVPRTVRVGRTLEQPIGRGTVNYYERSQKLVLQPGAVVSLELGGAGAVVTGRLSIDGTPPAQHVWRLNEAVTITKAGDNDPADERPHFRGLIDDKGAFQINDIPPGRYALKVYLTAAP